MDKNFIKIDDLFRQRMEGAEERERSGAWLNMRDLLDREMPQQKRIGILYWRRIFSAVAVLSLLGTVCIGSFEMSSVYKSVFGSSTSVSEYAYDASNNEPRQEYLVSVAADKPSDKSDANESATSHKAGLSTKEDKVQYTDDVATVENVVASSSTSTSSHKAANVIVDRPVNIDEKSNTSSIATTKTDTKTNRNTENKSDKSLNLIKPRVKKDMSSGTTLTTGNRLGSTNDGVDNKTETLKAQEGVQKDVQGKGENATADVATIANLEKEHVSKVAENTQQSGVTSRSTDVADNNDDLKAGTKSVASLPLGAGKTVDVKPVAPGFEKDNEEVAHMPVVSGGVAVSPERHAAGEHHLNATLPAASKMSSSTSEKLDDAGSRSPSEHLTTGGAISSKSAADKKSGEIYSTGGERRKETKDEPKRVISKLWVSVHESVVKDANNEYTYKVDTISMRRVNVDLDKDKGEEGVADNSAESTSATIGSEGVTASKTAAPSVGAANISAGSGGATATTGSTPGVAAKATAGKPGVTKASVAAHTEAGGLVSGESGVESTSASIPPAASVSSENNENAAGADEVAKTEEKKVKAKKGVSLIKKLAAAFNEVKTNAANTTFAPGIVAGINSNFFGPASFKGFQFGMSGNIIFNNTWNIMTELKYFNRINNNQSVEDNYYTYTPVGSQYRKEHLLNSYGFSALHSIEMPVAIRYSKGKFNFYTGGNFLYSFSINTGAATMTDMSTPSVLVNEVGNDNAPKLSQEDFNSRFGLGYLLGFSYEVGKNVNLDLRSVQTVWDNATSVGARSISTQLYKSPSLQLSIMYRLGGNRHRD